MSDFKLTSEQQDILDAFPERYDLVINALAGCSKTTILRLIARANPDLRMTYLAYNRSIAEEAQRLFPKNVIAKTIHAFAFASVGRNYVDRLNGPRVEAWKVADILGLPERFEYGSFSLRSSQLARLTTEAVKRFCHSAAPEPSPSHIPVIPGLSTEGARQALEELLFPFVLKAWEDVSSTRGYLRYDHDFYLKTWALGNPQLPGEVVLADEFQDSDMVIKQIVDNQEDAQRVVVGDENQRIYSFRSSVNCLSMYPDATHLPLTRTFRFGQAVAGEANLILDLLGSDIHLVGYDKVDSKLAVLTDPDCVLTRTNAGAIARLMSAQVDGVRAGLVGGTTQVEALAKAAVDLTEGRKALHHELIAFDTWDQVCQYVEEDPDAVELKVLVRLVDRHGSQALLDAVRRAVPEHTADLVISTAHKYKGKQAHRVQIASDFTSPYDNESGKWNQEELRLAYVAITRARTYLDHSTFDWLSKLADDSGYKREFLPASEVPPRDRIRSAPAAEQLVPDPRDATRLMFQNTEYSKDLINAQRSLPRSKFEAEYCGMTKVRLVLATRQALEVAERFGLSVSQAARDRVAALSSGQ